MNGQTVRLYPDATQDKRDRYDRLLAYVELPDGTDYGLIAIQRGHAREYAFKTAYGRQKGYQKAESAARRSDAGMWEHLPPMTPRTGCAGVLDRPRWTNEPTDVHERGSGPLRRHGR